MSEKELVIRADEVAPFSLPGEEHIYASQCIIHRDGAGSQDLVLNRYTLKAHHANKGGVHEGNDEAYYVLRGKAKLTLGGTSAGDEDAKVYDIGPDTAVFIPAGTFHAVENHSDEDLVILTFWPRQPLPGANGIAEAREKAWGTQFRRVPRKE